MLHLKKIIAGCVIGIGLAGCRDSDFINDAQ